MTFSKTLDNSAVQAKKETFATTLTKSDNIELTREGLRRLSCNLKNIYEVLWRAFEQFDKNTCNSILNKDNVVVLTYGMTGSGKSTLINSLIFGPHALELKQLKEDINIMKKSGRTTNK